MAPLHCGPQRVPPLPFCLQQHEDFTFLGLLSLPAIDRARARNDRREEAVASTEERLAKKERDLSQYVGQVQAQLERRDADWWEKQLGERPAALSG